jgi:hypothetical protein
VSIKRFDSWAEQPRPARTGGPEKKTNNRFHVLQLTRARRKKKYYCRRLSFFFADRCLLHARHVRTPPTRNNPSRFVQTAPRARPIEKREFRARATRIDGRTHARLFVDARPARGRRPPGLLCSALLDWICRCLPNPNGGRSFSKAMRTRCASRFFRCCFGTFCLAFYFCPRTAPRH